MLHFAFVHGAIGDGRDVPARLHRADIIGDIFGGGVIARGAASDSRRTGAACWSICATARPACRPSSAAPSRQARTARAPTQWREVGLGAQILRDLGVTSIRLRTGNPRKYVGLSGFGIEIAAIEPIDG